jgi:hypothetical protein
MASNEQYFAAIILSIIATSTFIGSINLAYNNQFPDLGSTSGSLVTQQSAALVSLFGKNIPSSFILDGQNYTYPSGFDTNITIIHGGTWSQSYLGYSLIADDFLKDPLITLRNVIPTGNIYTVTYAINNTPNAEFYITPRQLTSFFGTGKTGSDLRLEFKQDGIYIPTYPLAWGALFNGNDYFFALQNSQTTISGGSKIVTTLTDISSGEELSAGTIGKNSLLSVTKDGILLFSVHVRDLASGYFSESSTETPQYAGIGSHTPSFTVIEIKTPIQYSPNTGSLAGEKGEQGFWAAVIAFINMITGFFDGVIKFLGVLGTILRFSIVITPQLAGLSLIIAKLWRGTN